ncbi:MAG: type II toxin-antitoxin system VapB family antitoxin [Symploca sp. SIO2G7]|nr:type II toxin-antitoxin system VapB family antitoxin [Symploca sp. SIO2G7]
MGISIKDPEIQTMASELAKLTGRSITEAVKLAVEQALIQAKNKRDLPKTDPLSKRLTEIALRCAALPDQDLRSADDILGYDEFGLPS